jgi:hypothetical protein
MRPLRVRRIAIFSLGDEVAKQNQAFEPSFVFPASSLVR